MKKQSFLSLAAGSALAAAALSPVHAAQGNPFEARSLQQGYQVADAGKMAEASCGAAKKDAKQMEASCGAAKKDAEMKNAKKKDASCGASKKTEASCGAKK
ncbi:MAG: hypothetical protein OEY75_07560 [Hylemonella sp.]|nr:hypothetical protein [Hylemonella sp.]MDH5708959.1 hypothetical protein [Hylemonella sp.]